MVDLFRDELVNLVSHLGLKELPIDVYRQFWGGMLAAVWAATPSGSANLRRLVISNSQASMDAWRVRINKLRENGREVFDRAEEDKNFVSPECEPAVRVSYERHLSLARPWPPVEVTAALDWYGPSELYISGSLRDWTSVPLLSKIPVPTLLINGAEGEAQDVAMQPFFNHIQKMKWAKLDNAAHFSHVDQ
ncbi:hypothetical protein DL767_010898 [Monosporascus sp. MG133]|nr:hypothetical protein DL767_010898 [Monosporascus sp. MG133]